MSEPTQRQLIIDRRTALLDRQAELDNAVQKVVQKVVISVLRKSMSV